MFWHLKNKEKAGHRVPMSNDQGIEEVEGSNLAAAINLSDRVVFSTEHITEFQG